MTLRDIIKSAREVDRFDICITRSNLFNGIGKNDPYGKDAVDGKGFNYGSKLADVFSGRRHSLIGFTKLNSRYFDPVKKRYQFCDIEIFAVLSDGANEFAGKSTKDQQKARKEINVRASNRGLKDQNYSCVKKYQHKKTHVVRYKIYALASNHCNIRYLVAKELSHIITKTVVDGGILKSSDMLLRAIHFPKKIRYGAEIPAEQVGMFHAIETMLPWRLRVDFGDIVENTTPTADVNITLAKRFMIPLKVIELIRQTTHVNGETYCGFSHRENSFFDQTEGRYY